MAKYISGMQLLGLRPQLKQHRYSLVDVAMNQHNKGIVSVSINTQTNLLTVGSLDGDIGLYDLRSPSQCVRCSLLLPVDASQCQGVFNSALQWVSRLAGLLRSVDSSQFAFTNGNDIFIYDLTNPSNPFKACFLSLSHQTIVSSESDDFITSLAFSPRKYFAHGLLNGLVVVEFLSIFASGLTCRRVPYDGTTIDKDLRFRVGKNTNNIQHTVTGWLCREGFTVGSAFTIRLNTFSRAQGTEHLFSGIVSIEVVFRTLKNRANRCVL